MLGIVSPRNGSVIFDGEDVTRRSTSYRIGKGMAIVPENRRLFAPMTVLENLEMGAYLHGGGKKEDFDRVYELFPLLYERRSQLAGTLSGGEQQMVAMGRALMSKPKLLLMDEPSMGLAPILVERSFEIIKQVHESGVAMLIVEQNANVSLSIADRGYVLSTGRLVLEGTAAVSPRERGPAQGIFGSMTDVVANGRWRRCDSSAPRPVGSKLIVRRTAASKAPSRAAASRTTSSLAAQEVLRDRRAAARHVRDHRRHGVRVGLPCGGEIDVFVEPLRRSATSTRARRSCSPSSRDGRRSARARRRLDCERPPSSSADRRCVAAAAM